MIKIREAIVVEGRYDCHALRRLFDTVIVETGGFSIFKDREKLAYLRALAARRGLLVLTDPDGAGFMIRGYLKGAIPPAQVRHAYIPDIAGRERRKRTASKEGLLGVEGMDSAVLVEALRRAGATVLDDGAALPSPAGTPLTKADLYAYGLSGQTDSASKRAALQKKLGLPARLAPNSLLEALNALYLREDVEAALREVSDGKA